MQAGGRADGDRPLKSDGRLTACTGSTRGSVWGVMTVHWDILIHEV